MSRTILVNFLVSVSDSELPQPLTGPKLPVPMRGCIVSQGWAA